MKFAYIDESGDEGQSDVFVMAGILVDASKLRKWTAEFDLKLRAFGCRCPRPSSDFKTKNFIDGKKGWSSIDDQERKLFLADICKWVVACGQVYAYALSFSAFKKEVSVHDGLPGNQKRYWVAAALFIACLIQKKNQGAPKNKGHTVLIFDDNKIHMPKLSDGIYEANQWYDALYAVKKARRGQPVWEVEPDKRFDQIINTAFAIKSEHSSLVQVADILSYIYRRHLELFDGDESYDGEQIYYQGLVDTLKGKRQKLGKHCPEKPVVNFYRASKHKDWEI